jgi:hypothetical protein
MTGLVVGANAKVWPLLAVAAPGTGGVRQYHGDGESGTIPARWPDHDGPPAKPLLSVRPLPGPLLEGYLDDAIRKLCSTAPPGAMLNIWHEAPSLPGYAGMDWMTPETMRAMHVHMHDLCKGTGVLYGPVTIGPAHDAAKWIPGAAHPMDFYADDLYQFDTLSRPDGSIRVGAVLDRMNAFRVMVQEHTGVIRPRIVLAETNTPHVEHRAEWFSLVGWWLARHGGVRLLTFWRDDGPLSGPWLPDDMSVIGALTELAGGAA